MGGIDKCDYTFHGLTAGLTALPLVVLPSVAQAATVANPLCPAETAIYAPGHAQDIVVPPGFRVSVFARGLNAPTGIAFLGSKSNFRVFVLESGHGIPSRCNEQGSFGTGTFDPTNPFTPDVLVFDRLGNKIAGPLFKPTGSGATQTDGLQAAGPSIDIAFENGFAGGRLFATDSNQADPRRWAKQQLARRDPGPCHRHGEAVHHESADRRPPKRTAGVQRRLDLLVAGLDDR
jgi:hypothetical protein